MSPPHALPRWLPIAPAFALHAACALAAAQAPAASPALAAPPPPHQMIVLSPAKQAEIEAQPQQRTSTVTRADAHWLASAGDTVVQPVPPPPVMLPLPPAPPKMTPPPAVDRPRPAPAAAPAPPPRQALGMPLPNLPALGSLPEPAAPVATPAPEPPPPDLAPSPDAAADAQADAQAELARLRNRTGLSEAQLQTLDQAQAAIADGHPASVEPELQRMNRELAAAARLYTVSSGDQLWSIAAHPDIYDNRLMWPLIWNANRNTLPAPGPLKPGSVLRIPSYPTVDEVAAAISYARLHTP